MNILVIGNGFDLAHELPTKYIDFLKYMLKGDFSDIVDGTARYKLEQCNASSIWLKYFGNIMQEDGTWIDFENEISQVIQSLEYMMYVRRNSIMHPDQRIDYERSELEEKVLSMLDVQQNLFSPKNEGYYEKVILPLLNDLKEFTECLGIYCSQVVGSKDIEVASQQVLDLNIDKVLSFNYTNTYIKVYEEFRKLKQQSNYRPTEVDFIHGTAQFKVGHKKCNMVLGIDEYLENGQENKEVSFIGFKKYFQRSLNQTDQKYRKWINKGKNKVYVIGHSLDVTDKDILNEVFTMPGSQVTIYYHQPSRREELMINLVKIIGVDEFQKRVYPGGDIVFEEQHTMINKRRIDYHRSPY